MAIFALADYFKGFSKLNKAERLQRLQAMGALTPQEVEHLIDTEKLSTELAEKFVENVIGYFQLPLGIATNFRIDGHDYAIPMAVEETSIIAAASKTARWVKENGALTTEVLGHLSIGQIQIAKVKNFMQLAQIIEEKKDEFITTLNDNVAYGLVARDGGVMDMKLRKIVRNDGEIMAVIHVLVNTCDAMGANIINQICEFLKSPIENLTGEKVSMCILSNLNDKKLTRAKAIIRNIDPELGYKIQEASIFAEIDPYRAATNNKGVLNGMDPILIATGNDWRAVEAGVHAYCCRDGQYRSVTQWRMKGDDLIGVLEAPVSVGIVGGVTQLHPTAKLCLNMLKADSADKLSRIIAAVGLIQNLGAIKALTTVGIIEGHMKLHISNLSLSVGAKAQEAPILEKHLQEILQKTKRISLNHAKDILNKIRSANSQSIEN